jgi:hypothetical protein
MLLVSTFQVFIEGCSSGQSLFHNNMAVVGAHYISPVSTSLFAQSCVIIYQSDSNRGNMQIAQPIIRCSEMHVRLYVKCSLLYDLYEI